MEFKKISIASRVAMAVIMFKFAPVTSLKLLLSVALMTTNRESEIYQTASVLSSLLKCFSLIDPLENTILYLMDYFS